eukprot:350306-Chlamydomonas_euryale.AAC.1
MVLLRGAACFSLNAARRRGVSSGVVVVVGGGGGDGGGAAERGGIKASEGDSSPRGRGDGGGGTDAPAGALRAELLAALHAAPDLQDLHSALVSAVHQQGDQSSTSVRASASASTSTNASGSSSSRGSRGSTSSGGGGGGKEGRIGEDERVQHSGMGSDAWVAFAAEVLAGSGVRAAA